MKSQEARNQRDRSQTRKEEERKMRKEVEERLRSENLGVESILLNDNDDCLARRGKSRLSIPTQPNLTRPNPTQPNPTQHNIT